MSKPIDLYAGEVVTLLANAGVPRAQIVLLDSRYAMPTREWFLTTGLSAYKAQATETFEEAWDCDNVGNDFMLFMQKCNARNRIAVSPTVFRFGYLPGVFPWGKTNDQWINHMNDVAIMGDREVVFLEPQMDTSKMIYEPTTMDLGTCFTCGD